MIKNNFSYKTNIKHQELVQILGTQNLYLRVVFAHIDNYTQVKGGWSGSQRDLAAQLELPVATINNQLSELVRRGLIVQQANVYRSTREVSCSAKEPVREQKCSADEQKRSAGEPPITPIYNNKEKEKENYFVREETAQQNSPSSPSLFEEVVNAYRQRSGESQISQSEINESRNAWHALNPPTQKMLLAELQKPEGWCGKRLLWTITDFEPPKPVNYNGHWDADRLMKEGKLCCARMKGEETYATYLYEDALQWDMEIKFRL